MIAEIAISVVAIIVVIIIIKISTALCIGQCKSKASMVGKVIIVTGANSGLGFETAKDLAMRGGRVLLACRDEARALAARDDIVSQTNNTNVVYKHLDLSSLESVRRFAEDINNTEPRLDVLINNAGVHGYGNQYTADGIVVDMQINCFGPFLLTLLLLPLLKKTGASRIVNLTSTSQFLGRINLEHINKKGYYINFLSYSNSKLYMLLFTVELARRLQGTGVTTNAVHPGIIMTNIVSKSDLKSRISFGITCWLCSRTILDGVQTIIYLAVANECANTSGKFFIDCKETFMSWKAYNKRLTADLWDYSEKLVGYNNNKNELVEKFSYHNIP